MQIEQTLKPVAAILALDWLTSQEGTLVWFKEGKPSKYNGESLHDITKARWVNGEVRITVRAATPKHPQGLLKLSGQAPHLSEWYDRIMSKIQ